MLRISYARRKDIDTQKWDSCIARSVNGMVYAYAWYLDIVAPDWDALIANDYEYVFPLPHRRKYAVRYIFQPSFSQQLGLFSASTISEASLNEFIKAIPMRFRHITLNLNTYNRVSAPAVGVKQRVTYHLDLLNPYPTLAGRYTPNTKRNISKALALGVWACKGLSIAEMIEFKTKHQAVPLRKEHLGIMGQIMRSCIARGVGELYGAYSKANQLCAAVFFVKSNGKAIYLWAGSSQEGKQNRAMFALVDHFINQNSETHLTLDFEGSSIESIGRFYAGFGATPSNFPAITINRLPWFLKIWV